MHIDSMITRIHPITIYIVGGYFGLFVLCILLLHSAGSPNAGVLTFDVVHNRCNEGFVNTIATMLNLQISMYVLRGLFDNGAAFALSFSCLAVILYKLNSVGFVQNCIFCFFNRIASWKRILRYCIVPGIFCTLAVINAYLCQPVGPFVFARWLVVNAPLTQYFFAGLLVVVMEQQMLRLAKNPGVSVHKFTIKAFALLCFFKILGDYWPDMGNPIGEFVLSYVNDNSGTCIFGSPSYHSNLPSSALVWDAAFILFVLIAAGATQLGVSRLILNTVKFRGRFFAPKLFTTKFVLSVTLAALTLSVNLIIVGTLLDAWTMKEFGLPGCNASEFTSFILSCTSSSIFGYYLTALVVTYNTSKIFRTAYMAKFAMAPKSSRSNSMFKNERQLRRRLLAPDFPQISFYIDDRPKVLIPLAVLKTNTRRSSKT